ncbi:hypothetical protein M2103_000179 [Ereboglobus sp. PH5-5]|uniref:hypothetical protein n=1 Tax=Ereboglobus sp. PH5-5 TaxID=2940529 RepID=UPI0024056BD5|nr:hypothetical protein [Ereboglobus sp. PH5-5]MDF9831975.1 hypothetical protein [Ereboglobus sp. PH5-5]
MKQISLLLATLALLLGAGCKSNIANLREHINPTYHDVIVETDEDAAFAAARTALVQMGYKITSSGVAQKKIEAISAISSGDMGRAARQVSASVRFGVAPDNTTAIQILFIEILEDSGMSRDGMATKQPLRESGLYGVFEKYVNEALKAGK